MRRRTAVSGSIGLSLALAVALGPATPASPVAAAPATPAAPAAVWQTCKVKLGGVSMTVRATEKTRTVVDQVSRQRARLTFWVRDETPCGFTKVVGTRKAWLGANGVMNGKTRRQGTMTTPTGTYTMTEAFGIAANPGTALPYHRVRQGDWWVQDNNSKYYNHLRNQKQGGFAVTTRGANGSERLLDYGKQYAHVVVINFNRAPDKRVRKRGSGIFLHVNSGRGPTAGCVSITKAQLVTILSQLQSGDRITIVR